ncbi:MAG TPA: hypothetical protein VJ740_06525, partial [Hyphomicrobiaceae bacterium]|nr:hypothetical protein [Hyphomicrobiaceae bacterium]
MIAVSGTFSSQTLTGVPASFSSRRLAGVREIPRAAWGELFPGDAEGWDYYAACEASPPPAFSFSAIAVTSHGRYVAAAPVFRLNYRLDTPLQGSWRPFGE